MNNTYVRTEDMKIVASNINSKREEISKIFKTKLLPILETSKECLNVSGLNYDDVIKSYENLFNSLDTQLNKLTDALVNQIIPSYNESSQIITKMFNSDFAKNMQDALTMMNK